MPNEFKVKNGLLVSGSANISASGSAVFTIDGTADRLFTVDDTTSGSLFSVNTAAGLPIIEAFSDNTVRIGQFGQRALFVSQSKVGINKESALNGLLDVSGSLTVTGSIGILGTVSASSYTGSLLGTASFATTGSNTFIGNQIVTGSVTLSGSAGIELTVRGDQVNTGSLTVVGAVSASSFTGSLLGTASFAVSASWAPNTGGGGGSVTVADEGTTQGTATYFNFIGAGVTAAVASNTASITISGGGGGGGTPGGANTSIQFNDGGAFSGSGDFTFDKTLSKVRLNGNFQLAENKSLYFENSIGVGSGYISYTPTNYGALNGQDLTIGNGANGVVKYNAGLTTASTSSAHLWSGVSGDQMILNASGNLGIGTGIDPFDPFNFPKAKLYVQDSGSALLVISGSRGELLRIQDSGSSAGTLAVISSGSRNIATFTTSSVIITGSLQVSGSFTASLQSGYTWVGNSSGVATPISTASIGGGGSVSPRITAASSLFLFFNY